MEIKTNKESYDSEKYFKTIFDVSIDGIAVVDAEGKIEFANESFFKIIDWPREEIIKAYFMKIIPEDFRECVIGYWQNIQTDHSGMHEIRIKTGSGNIKFLNVSSSMVGINGTNKIVAIIHDISEKKKHEIDLKESEKRYKDLFENANDPMYTHDLLGNFLSVNRLGIELLGGTEEEILGSNIIQWLTPESYKAFEENAMKILLNQQFEPVVVVEVLTKKGEHKFGEARIRLIRDGERIIAIHGIVRDITEKMQLEKELKESEAKFRDLFENANDAMYVMDIQGNFLKMNRTGLSILGCKKEDIIGTNISQWVTKESMNLVNRRKQKRMTGEFKDRIDVFEVICKNGEHRWAEVKTRDIKDGENTIEIHGIGRDITENMLLKQELNKSNKQHKLLCYLIQGTRGGKTRALILRNLSEKSYNANQLATAMNMDYKTIRHHLNVLVKNGIISKGNDGYSDLYFISKNIEMNLNMMSL